MLRIGKIKDLINELIEKYNSGKIKKDKDYKLEISEYKESKTEKQLALYNATLREIQKVMFNSTGLTRDILHNTLLAEVGIIKRINGKPKIITIPADYEYLKDNEMHLKSINVFIGKDGKEWRNCYELEESKNFTTDQFKDLIDALTGFIQENDLQDKIDTRHLQDLQGGTV